jgi:hypothetical protein
VFVFLIRDPKAGDTSAMACFVYVAAGAFGVQRRAFVGNCVASWLLLCTAAMAETAGAQSSLTGTCFCQADVSQHSKESSGSHFSSFQQKQYWFKPTS